MEEMHAEFVHCVRTRESAFAYLHFMPHRLLAAHSSGGDAPGTRDGRRRTAQRRRRRRRRRSIQHTSTTIADNLLLIASLLTPSPARFARPVHPIQPKIPPPRLHNPYQNKLLRHSGHLRLLRRKRQLRIRRRHGRRSRTLQPDISPL